MTTITIENDSIACTTPEGKRVAMPLSDFVRKAWRPGACSRGVGPAGVRLIDSAGPITIWVYEIAPSVRCLKWIADESPSKFGQGTIYRTVRISLPYLVVLAAFEDGVLSDYNECFFRNKPLEDEDDELHYPALLNCSKFTPSEGKPLSWICTQKLDRSPIVKEKNPKRRMSVGLKCLVQCLLDAGFNYSSEHHEGTSWFTESVRVDKRVSTVDRWQEATVKDPLFAVDVPWLKTKMTLRGVIDRMFANQSARFPSCNSASDLARLIVNHAE
jgi:hypothetical protein